MVRIVHIMRGRLRLRMDAVKRQPRMAARLHEHLMTVSGIRQVEVKSRTGSVLLTYDPQALGSADFLDELSSALGALFPAYFAPGRAHIRVDLLKGRPQLVRRIRQLLTSVSGIHRLEIDPSDGACLLVYDSGTVTSPEFIDAVSRPLSALLPQMDVREILCRTGLGATGRNN